MDWRFDQGSRQKLSPAARCAQSKSQGSKFSFNRMLITLTPLCLHAHFAEAPLLFCYPMSFRISKCTREDTDRSPENILHHTFLHNHPSIWYSAIFQTDWTLRQKDRTDTIQAKRQLPNSMLRCRARISQLSDASVACIPEHMFNHWRPPLLRESIYLCVNRPPTQFAPPKVPPWGSHGSPSPPWSTKDRSFDTKMKKKGEKRESWRE